MNTADAIRGVLQRKAAALVQRSAPKLLELLEADFVYVTASGRRLRRDDYVENGTGPRGLRFQSQEIDRFEVADFGDTAIATMILHDRFEVEGRTIAKPFLSAGAASSGQLQISFTCERGLALDAAGGDDITFPSVAAAAAARPN